MRPSGRVARYIVLLGTAALIAACAQSVVWQRADTAPYQSVNDLGQCWSQAEAAVPIDPVPFQQQPSFGVVPNRTGAATANSEIVVPFPGQSGADASVQQRRTWLVDRCMRGQGYTQTR